MNLRERIAFTRTLVADKHNDHSAGALCRSAAALCDDLEVFLALEESRRKAWTTAMEAASVAIDILQVAHDALSGEVDVPRARDAIRAAVAALGGKVVGDPLPASDSDRMLDAIFDSARRHGEDGSFEDGATHEVGDLQDALRLAWASLPTALRSAVYRMYRKTVAADEEMPAFDVTEETT